MSALWLDTELTDDDHRRIAAVLRHSGCTVAELEAICRSEVAPVVSGNLLSVAGVWAGFDPAWLEREILQRLRRPSMFIRGYRFFGVPQPRPLLGAQRHWAAIARLLTSPNHPGT